jgi:hypothetical protein
MVQHREISDYYSDQNTLAYFHLPSVMTKSNINLGSSLPGVLVPRLILLFVLIVGGRK